jgi:hypothetical protein
MNIYVFRNSVVLDLNQNGAVLIYTQTASF